MILCPHYLFHTSSCWMKFRSVGNSFGKWSWIGCCSCDPIPLEEKKELHRSFQMVLLAATLALKLALMYRKNSQVRVLTLLKFMPNTRLYNAKCFKSVCGWWWLVTNKLFSFAGKFFRSLRLLLLEISFWLMSWSGWVIVHTVLVYGCSKISDLIW